MSQAILVPISVAAHLVRTEQTAPQLGGAPFNREAKLEPGVHLHWALPDALTCARIPPKGSDALALFPGVPDLWLVVRLNPGGAAGPRRRQRSWRAWVVDSRTQSVAPFDSNWQPPALPARRPIHTAAGLLPPATRIGYSGWGQIIKQTAAFDPLVAAYYPAARRRFGFHDPLEDLPGAVGQVSYVVIGWYADPNDDPLFRSKDREALLKSWKLIPNTIPIKIKGMPVNSHTTAAPAAPTWQPASLRIAQQGAAAPARLRRLQRGTQVRGTPAARQAQAEGLAARFARAPAIAAAAAPQQISIADPRNQLGMPAEMICHGSVFEVSLRGTNTMEASLGGEVRLYPSITRALAEIASLRIDSEKLDQPTQDGMARDVDFVEMLIQELDHQKGTVGGVLDLPGAAHARTFQGIPGKSSFYARMDICPGTVAAPITAQAVSFAQDPPDPNTPQPPGSGQRPPWRPPPPPQPEPPAACLHMPAALRRTPGPLPQGPPSSPSYKLALEPLLANWRNEVRTAHEAAVDGAGQPISDRLIYVHDFRKQAQSPGQGLTSGDGSDESGWWLDVESDAELDQLFLLTVGANVRLPSSDYLYEQPGPRWYRPWSPQVVLLGAGRSYRFGADGSFEDDGFLRCREAPQIVTDFTINGHTVTAQSLADTTALADPDLPGEARLLVEESILLDSESSALMDAPAGGPTGHNPFQLAVRGLWLRSVRPPGDLHARDALSFRGTLPSPIGFSVWNARQFDPLFLDVDYSHPYSSVADDWKLDEHHVECTPASDPPAPADGVLRFAERAHISTTLAEVLDSALLSKQTLDPRGTLIRTPINKTLKPDTFKKMAMISAALTGFDQALIDQHQRGERTGALRLNRVELVDVFGVRRVWSGPIAPESPDGGPQLPYWTQLTPRLPGWSRLQFRLQPPDTQEQASSASSAICGFLLPDFVEHALEVYDGTGAALGQLVNVLPPPNTPFTALAIQFEAHPWAACALAPGEDPIGVIKDDTLRDLVAGVRAQTAIVAAGRGVENGLTAMLRVLDTIRGTLDPTAKSSDRRLRMIGEPIVVLSAQLMLETTSATKPEQLIADPPLVEAAAPRVPVRIGDLTRPDDGVLGCFIAGTPPEASRFAAVSSAAATGAIRSALIGDGTRVPATHPFVAEQASLLHLAPGEKPQVVVLADTRGEIYVTSGVLPRKKISIPREMLDAALQRLQPTFHIGPLLALPLGQSLKPALPQPQIEGMHATFVRSDAANEEAAFEPRLSLGELPVGRALLTEGWIRLSYDDEDES
jgi:hypothetical protein